MTRIVYAADAPLAALVVETRPGTVIERSATTAERFSTAGTIDLEEPDIVYAAADRHLTALVWPVALVALAGAAWLGRRRP